MNENTLEEVVKGVSGPVEGLREVSLCHFFLTRRGSGIGGSASIHLSAGVVSSPRHGRSITCGFCKTDTSGRVAGWREDRFAGEQREEIECR